MAFVITVAALPGCRTGGPGPHGQTEPETTDDSASKPPFAYVGKGSGEGCNYMPHMSCPKNVMCNPPPPTEIDCPPEADAGTNPDPAAARRPAGKERWLRVRPQLHVSRWGCAFAPAGFCPPTDVRAACEMSETIKLSCEQHHPAGAAAQPGEPRLDGGALPSPPAGHEGHFFVRSFVYRDWDQSCHEAPDFWCDPGQRCRLPETKTVPCPAQVAR
jgi:hypothetical protein